MVSLASLLGRKKQKHKARPISAADLPSFILTKAPIHSKFSKEITPTSIESCDEPLYVCVLSNNILHDMLKEFARAEVSIENVRIWDAIQNYRTAPNFEERLQLAHHIYNTFLAPDAPMEVNITKKTIEAVWKNIEDGCMCEWLFDRVEKEVRECLEDMLKRFIQTEEYQSFMEQCKKEKRKSQRFSQVLQGFKLIDVNI